MIPRTGGSYLAAWVGHHQQDDMIFEVLRLSVHDANGTAITKLLGLHDSGMIRNDDVLLCPLAADNGFLVRMSHPISGPFLARGRLVFQTYERPTPAPVRKRWRFPWRKAAK